MRVISAILVALATACASGGPRYLGPGPGSGTAGVEVDRARVELDAARAADDRRDDRSGREHAARAVEILQTSLRADPHSRAAAETLGEAYYIQGHFGGRGAFERAVTHLERVLAVDPDALEGARWLAHAYARLGVADRVAYYAGYVESMAGDPELMREMTELRKPFQQEFLASWNEYEGFYQSRAAVLQEMDPATFQFRTIVQVTPQFEQELAARGLQQITAQLQFRDDPETQAYLQKVVDKLVAATPGPPFQYAVQLVESQDVNAMAFPGRILVNTGLLRFAENEAELVAVLSHELAHIYAHHSARQFLGDYQRRRLTAAILANVDLGKEYQEQLLNLGAVVTLELINRGYSRAQEKEADRYGTHIAFNGGYNPTFMTSFFVRLYESNPNHPWKILATHPPTTERIEYTAEYLEAFPLDVEMQIDSEEFQNMKARLR